jgi:hypothetical protein
MAEVAGGREVADNVTFRELRLSGDLPLQRLPRGTRRDPHASFNEEFQPTPQLSTTASSVRRYPLG